MRHRSRRQGGAVQGVALSDDVGLGGSLFGVGGGSHRLHRAVVHGDLGPMIVTCPWLMPALQAH